MRDFEREIIPMCAAEGMGLCPWGALGGGKFKTAARREQDEKNGNPGRKQATASENDIAVSAVLERVAQRHNTLITSVALAYVMQKTPYVVPIVGGRTVEHLKGNIEGLAVVLTEKDIEDIEAAYPFEVGFPMNFLFDPPVKQAHASNSRWMKRTGHFDYVENPKPIAFGK